MPDAGRPGPDGGQWAPDPLAAVTVRLRSAGCVFAEDEAELLVDAARTPAELERLVTQRTGGRPLEQVLGWAEFCGLRIVVEPGVFVPRRRTALLVERAAALTAPGDVVVDLCCGSGAVGAALAAAVGPLRLSATDIDQAAVRCARRNLPAGSRVLRGDLYAPLPGDLRGRVQVLVANAPYVPSDQLALLPPEARVHEPRVALDGGLDGLDVQRRVVAGSPEWLAPGGVLLVETSARQAPFTAGACESAGLVAEVVWSPELEATVVVAAAPGAVRDERGSGARGSGARGSGARGSGAQGSGPTATGRAGSRLH